MLRVRSTHSQVSTLLHELCLVLQLSIVFGFDSTRPAAGIQTHHSLWLPYDFSCLPMFDLQLSSSAAQKPLVIRYQPGAVAQLSSSDAADGRACLACDFRLVEALFHDVL